mgnify:CR=1 FL=1
MYMTDRVSELNWFGHLWRGWPGWRTFQQVLDGHGHLGDLLGHLEFGAILLDEDLDLLLRHGRRASLARAARTAAKK